MSHGKRRRVGVFGGSFDPIHDGHIAVAIGALREGGLDEVWLMVSPENPLKRGRLHTSEDVRLEMVEAALDSLPEDLKGRIKVSDFEFRLPRPSYTIDTLHALKKARPDCRFCWIVGGDNLEIISRWKDYDRILSEFGLIVYPRPDAELPELIPEGVTYINNVAVFPFSSTEIRNMLKTGCRPTDLPVPDGVKAYLQSHSAIYR